MSSPTCRNALLSELTRYGFTEVGDVVMFLRLICPTVPDDAAILYMHEKLAECLKNHDNGSDYFDALRNVTARLGNEVNISLGMQMTDRAETFYGNTK